MSLSLLLALPHAMATLEHLGSASGYETLEVRPEMIESKNGFPVYPQELLWENWEMEKPCIEPSLLVYLEFSLLHSSAHTRS